MEQCQTNLKLQLSFSYRVEIKEDEGIFTSSELRNNKKTQKVYWIYKESSDEEAFFNGVGHLKQSDRCVKIFVMLGGCGKNKKSFQIDLQ